VQIDITLPRMPCDWISIAALDVSGHIQAEVDHDLSRQRLNSRGQPISTEEKHEVGPIKDQIPDHLNPEKKGVPDGYCGSCYGANSHENQCCNTCEEVRAAYREKGWIMPDYESVEQCTREGFTDSILAVV
jgi:endoplasmic reticulum-Golgi intermediate compartment protein 3